MAQFKVKGWEEYQVPDLLTATIDELRKTVRRAAKAANQRLVRLERAGYTSGAYRLAEKYLSGQGRRRYSETVSKKTLPELRREYASLRQFISSKSSTVQGRKDTDRKRYETAVQRGFKGSYDDFYLAVEKLYTERTEALYSSDVIYTSILTGTTDVIEEVVNRSRSPTGGISQGEALKEYLRAYKKRKNASDQ